MKAIILAAGRGSRMGGLTQRSPKCMTLLDGRPLIEWQFRALREAGIDNIGVVRGYMAEKIAYPEIETFDNPRWAETNMVSSLTRANDWLATDDCIVSYADIIYPASTITALAKARHEIAITYDVNWRRLWEARFDDPIIDAETFRVDQSGRLLEIGGRPETLDEVQGQYMGLLRFSPRGWRKVTSFLNKLDGPVRDKLDVTSLLQALVSSGVAIGTIPIRSPWFEIDSASDLELCQRQLDANLAGIK